MDKSIADILFQVFQELARIAKAMEESNAMLKAMAQADVYEVRREEDVEG